MKESHYKVFNILLFFEKMKRLFFLIMSIMTLCLSTTSCSKDDVPGFDKSIIIGTWDLTEAYINGQWIDLTSSKYSHYQASITFKDGGQYTGKGYFGNGDGTYTYDGKIINTYVSGKLYYSYEIASLTQTSCELIMSNEAGDTPLKIKAKKR